MTRLNRFLLLLLLAVLGGIASTGALADVPVPALGARVTDLAGVLSGDQQAGLESTLRAFEQRKGSQVAVLLVPTTEPETIEQYSIRVAEQWKLGRKRVDDGAILVVAVQDRTLRIEVGYGLEGALPDATAKRIVSEVMVPRFKAGDMPGGIQAGVNSILKVIDGEPLPPPRRGSSARFEAQAGGGFIAALLLFFLLVNALGWLWRAIFGRLVGSVVGGGLMGALAWLLTGTLLLGVIGAAVAVILLLAGGGVSGARHAGRRWGAPGLGGMGGLGGRGGFGGLGGGGFGGFSGGGGGFGGGGASGNW
jgi:uncharacterized protein